jgi:hypothetical protein
MVKPIKKFNCTLKQVTFSFKASLNVDLALYVHVISAWELKLSTNTRQNTHKRFADCASERFLKMPIY